MNIRTPLFLGLFLLTATAHANLIAHWKLDDANGSASIADASGNGRTAVQGAAGAGVALGGTGVDGTASTFGDAGYWVTGNDAAFSSRSFTVSLWIKAEPATASWRSPVSNRNGENGFIMYRATGSSSIQFWLRGPSGWNQQAAPNITAFDKWYHVVGSYDDATNEKKFYFHGEDDSWGSLINTITADEYIAGVDQLGIGARGPNGDTPWGLGGDQLIDDVQFYNTALSDQQVQFLFNNPGLAVPEPATGLMLALSLAGLCVLRRR